MARLLGLQLFVGIAIQGFANLDPWFCLEDSALFLSRLLTRVSLSLIEKLRIPRNIFEGGRAGLSVPVA
jgi:hypothetical protein